MTARKMTSEEAAGHQRDQMNADVEYLKEWGISVEIVTQDAAFSHRCGYTVYADIPVNLADIVQRILKLRKEHVCE